MRVACCLLTMSQKSLDCALFVRKLLKLVFIALADAYMYMLICVFHQKCLLIIWLYYLPRKHPGLLGLPGVLYLTGQSGIFGSLSGIKMKVIPDNACVWYFKSAWYFQFLLQSLAR